MELKIIEQKKNQLDIEIIGEDHTFSNVLKQELWNDKNVKVASYNVKHPLVGVPHFVIETNGSVSPKDALASAANKVNKQAEKFRAGFLKEVK